MREGHGTCRGHHGELLQGVFTWTPSSSSRRDHESQWHGLVTLPMNSRHTRARFVPDPPHTGRAPTSTTPRGHRLRGETRRTKARRAAELALDYLATTHGLHLTGELTITSTLPSGWGMGSSTADVVATIRAVTDSAHVTLPTHHLARLAVAAEGASDPTMNNDTQGTSLFAQRKGIIFTGGTTPCPRSWSSDVAAGNLSTRKNCTLVATSIRQQPSASSMPYETHSARLSPPVTPPGLGK